MSRAAQKGTANHATQQSVANASRVQAKLSVGKAGDSYEREADRVADQVVSGRTSDATAGGASQSVAPTISRLVSRKPEARLSPDSLMKSGEEKEEPQAKLQAKEKEEESQAKLQCQEEEEAQAKLQAKEKKEQPQAKLQCQEEEEAQTKLQTKEKEEEPQAKLQCQEEAQTKLQTKEKEEEPQARLQPKGEEEEEAAQTKLQPKGIEKEEKEKPLQAKGEPRANVRDKRHYPVLDQVEDKLFANKGRGETLDDETRRQMEVGFGADFSGVKIHTGGDAEAMSRDLKAQAFTHGNDIFFNSGKYAPESLHGKTLLAHELTHVVQQGAAKQKVSQERVAENDAKRNQAPPEPTDVPARQAEKASEKQAAALAKGAQPAPTTPGTLGDSTAAPIKPDAEVAEKPQAEGKEKPEGEEKGKEKGVPAAEKGKDGTKKQGAGKAKGKKGGGIGAYLRQVTEKVFQSKKSKITQLAGNEKKKDPADEKLKQTESAVVPPAAEGESRANAGQVAKVEQTEAPKPDEKKAKESFDQALDNAVPATLEEVDKFKEEGKGRVVGEAVKGVVSTDTQDVKSAYQEVENAPEPAPPEPSQELPEVEVAPETESIDPGDGLVAEVKPEHVDFSEYENESDEMLKKEGIEQEHLDLVDEGELAEANKERKQLKAQVKDGPSEVRAEEAKEKQQVNESLKREELEGRQKMRDQRQQALQGARGDQQKTKSAMELKRQQVTDHINGIYTRANTAVKQKLENLEKQSLKAFDQGQAKATKSFENNVNRRIDAFKARRYDRIGGSLLWAKDKLFGMDDLPEVENIFESEKSRFVTAVDGLVKTITEDNKRVVQECREIVANARKEIETYVEGLGPALKQVGSDAMKEMKGKLDALDTQINDKEKELQKKLAEKREAAIKAIEEKIEKMKEAMSGLISKLGNLLLEAMMKFFKWALKKAGYSPDQLMEIINKGKAVIKKIVGDPIAFLKNIVTAVKNGIGQFKKNIKKHLIAGMVSWLTGAMADVPIQLPEKWDLKGILHLVLQILGLTWDRIRTKLVKRIGEKAVRVAETTVDIVKRIVVEGPIALWEMIKEKAASIKQQVMDGIRNWAITQIVKQGILKLVSMLNPAGAIVQAVLAIYNTVMFFVENWQRIVEFVKSIFNSISDIAMGKLSKAAQMVENAMAMTIPIIMGFLARFIGLSGIGKTITDIIKKIRKPIDKVVDKVIDKVVGMAKKLLMKGKAGVKALKEKGLAIIQWWKKRKKLQTKNGESHTIYFKGKGKSAKLMIASTPTEYTDYVRDLIKDQGLDAKDSNVKKALKIADDIDKEKAKTVSKDKEKQQAKDIAEMVDKLVTATKDLPLADAGGKNTAPSYGPIRNGWGTFAKVKYLQSPHDIGSEPKVPNDPNFEAINIRRKDKGSLYVKGHLLNDNLGGPGTTWKNLTPITGAANSDHKVNFEKIPKIAVNGTDARITKSPKTPIGAMEDFRCVATYGRSLPPAHAVLSDMESETYPAGWKDEWDAKTVIRILEAEQFVPNTIECSVRYKNKLADPWKTHGYTVKNDISYGDLNKYQLVASPKVTFEFAKEIDWSKSDFRQAMAKVMKLELIGEKRAKAIYDRFIDKGSIHSFKAVTGITLKALSSRNERYSFKLGNKS